MTPNDIRNHLNANPNQAIGIRMNNGQAFEVRHRDFVYVTRTALYIFNPSSESGLAEDLQAICALRNISTIEPLPAKAA